MQIFIKQDKGAIISIQQKDKAIRILPALGNVTRWETVLTQTRRREAEWVDRGFEIIDG